MSDWMKTCKEIGGPANVDLESCFQQNYGCQAFKAGECDFDEEYVISNIPGLFPPPQCQVCTSFLINLINYYYFSIFSIFSCCVEHFQNVTISMLILYTVPYFLQK